MGETRTIEPTGYARTQGDEGTATEAIALAVAEAGGTSPMHRESPLDDVIDADLVDRLFAGTGEATGAGGGRVISPYRGQEVTVTADGYVAVDAERLRCGRRGG